ncbi:MAG TPA: DUF2752 domain-containing protein [Nocardioides sp.]|uniref:DUF2752 domain-containing protein n=1 Tax=Nocardioides sp. TaxID=35761 RepID=UPI002E2F9D26|nr:DUF2752 domain-containing protein [Nocardioides sp.]HEX5090371.1 DUF2752 domain-containing protein [Nocardioides sp.]
MATIGGLALATLALHLRDPHQDGSWGFCPLHASTGLYCPGCGGLRAVNDLTNGEVGAALSSNLLVTLGIPVAVVLLAVWGLDRWTGHSRLPVGRRWTQVAVALVGLFAVFTVVRNLPFGAWLAP